MSIDPREAARRIVEAREELRAAMDSDREKAARTKFYVAIVECSTTVARALLAGEGPLSGPLVHDVQWIKKQTLQRWSKVLEFYADPSKAKDEFGEPVAIPDFYRELDFGSRAQDALAGKDAPSHTDGFTQVARSNASHSPSPAVQDAPLRERLIELVVERLYDYRAHGSIDFPDNMPLELAQAMRSLSPLSPPEGGKP